MTVTVRVLLIEDNPADARFISELLRDACRAGPDVELTWVQNLVEGVVRLQAKAADVVLLDLGLPESTGLDTVCRLFSQVGNMPALVVLSGASDEEVALQALREGAQDYLVKGHVDAPLLARSIRYAMGRAESELALREANARLEQRVLERTTELARAVDALRQEARERERAESANQSKSRFLAAMSHDLRTPLNGILGFAQILLLEGDAGPRQRESVLAIQRSGEHLLLLINDLLDMAKIEAGKFELCIADCKIEEVIHVVSDLISVKIAQKPQLRFAVELDPDFPTHLRADERRLRQVLINLLDNAVKFSDAGTITLRGRSVAPGRLRFEIEDTGTSLTDDQVARIFQPFEQVGDARQRSQGTGLGLIICRELVRLMDGDIRVEKGRRSGNLFSFDIAAEALPAPAAAQDFERANKWGPRRAEPLGVYADGPRAGSTLPGHPRAPIP